MNRFHFKGFEPEEALKSKANISLNRILDFAPFGSTAVALLEKDKNGYHCLLDVYSRHGPFMASAIHSTPMEVIALVEKKMTEQLCRSSKLKPDECKSTFKRGSHPKTEREDSIYEYEKSTHGYASV